MAVYYHITKRKNLVNILSQGLFPGARRGISPSYAPKRTQVYLTNDVRYVAEEQAGQAWCRRYDPVVLAVEIEEENMAPVRYNGPGTYTISGFEFTCDAIHPKQLRLAGSLREFLAAQALLV